MPALVTGLSSMMPPQEFRPESNHGVHGSTEENEPVKGEWDSPTEERRRSGDRDQGRMPEIIAWPKSDPDSNPTARYDEPDECPHANVPAH